MMRGPPFAWTGPANFSRRVSPANFRVSKPQRKTGK
jgi:hypothetical protein